MQPLTAEIGRVAAGIDGPGAAAGPVASFQHQKRHLPRLNQSARRADPGSTRANHRDIDLRMPASSFSGLALTLLLQNRSLWGPQRRSNLGERVHSGA
jgi:hypothetical protein